MLFRSNTPSFSLPGLPDSVLLATPQGPGVDNTTCQGLWGRVGTLCNLTSLMKYDQKQTKKLQALTKDYNLLIDTVTQITKQAKITFPHPNSDTKNILDNLPTIDFLTKAKVNAGQCLREMAAVRSSSLCSRCSQDQATYLLATTDGQKFSVSDNFCARMMKACTSHFEDLATVSSLFFERNGSLKELSKLMGTSLTPLTDSCILSRVSAIIKMIFLIKDWRQADQETKISIGEQICAMTINLRDEVITSTVERSLRKISGELLAELEKGAPKVTNSRALGPSDVLSLHRSVLETESENAAIVMPGDVAVLSATDNMFTSFNGVAGSPLSIENSAHLKTMNLTVCFP